MSLQIFVTGIDTGIGKTIASAVLVKALAADYWKPVQAGDLDYSDSKTIESLVPGVKVHPEAYRLSSPMSPHAAAKIDGVAIKSSNFVLPDTSNPLIIEGAGGLCVPLNDEFHIVDLISTLSTACILVSKNYLGSINHTLLSVEVLKKRGINILGLIFNGDTNAETETYIENFTGLPTIARIPDCKGTVDSTFISQVADRVAPHLKELV